MNRGPTIFLGVFLTFAAAWLALVLAPYLQLGGLQPAAAEAGEAAYPRPLGGAAARGRDVYRANGCLYCHSQQVRPEGFGADIKRGWGTRRTVARDYLYDKPVLLGTMRTGPDLANIGARQPSASWHHKHLYNPQITSPGSIMPPFPFLYERRKVAAEVSHDALDLPPEWAPPAGWQILPTEDGKALVAYLQSLDHTHPLAEADN